MDDNARPHRARVVEQYLHSETLTAWTGQHVHQTSAQLNMLGTCYRQQFQLVLYNQPAYKSSELH